MGQVKRTGGRKVTAAKLMDGVNRKQQAQTSTRRKILPRPNTERTGANGKRTKERFGACPNVIQLSLRQSGEQGNSRHRQAPESE